jgi:hypothetical protein
LIFVSADRSAAGCQGRSDLPREPKVDFPMARNSRRPLGIEAPEAVVASLAQELRAVLAQVSLPGRGASRVDDKLERFAIGTRDDAGVLANAQLEDSRRASITFPRASSRVRPWLLAPGTSGIEATIQPSSPSSKTIVTRSDSLIAQR